MTTWLPTTSTLRRFASAETRVLRDPTLKQEVKDMVAYVELWHNDTKVKTVESRMEAIAALRGFVKMGAMMGMDVDLEGWYTVTIKEENMEAIDPKILLR